jgi:hypothetical protein
MFFKLLIVLMILPLHRDSAGFLIIIYIWQMYEFGVVGLVSLKFILSLFFFFDMLSSSFGIQIFIICW